VSTLLLVRHGQAAAYEPDSDRLTELGERQARRIGDYLAEQGIAVDEVRSGSLERHRRTRDLIGESFAGAGRTWPSFEEDPRWNEYDAPGVINRLLPALAEADPAFGELVRAFQDNAASSERNRHFQRMFEVVMDRWQRGEISADGVEPFAMFHQRVLAVFSELTRGSGNRTVLVVSSGGPVGVCVQSALSAPPLTALQLNWRVRNGSLTEMLFSRGRVSLECFNAAAHFEPDLRTFR
jgi:broad specificity phosphatase PhoE